VSLDLDGLADELDRFASESDWHRLHNPKNLAMALAAEAGELLEQFQWLTPEDGKDPMPYLVPSPTRSPTS